MKLKKTQIENITKYRTLILAGTLAAVAATAACSQKPEPKFESVQPQTPVVKPASLQVVTPSYTEPKSVETKSAVAVKQPASKVQKYKSRDYGVSFEYPWQYAYVNARTIANSESLQPKSDGFEGQIALARIDVPTGFYPDTDFESAYFTLGLNPDLAQEDCDQLLASEKDVKTETVNGTEFRWAESESGGNGSASKVRNYVTFANGMCYEIELGLNTKNEDGLAREVSSQQVMSRLESMLNTVKIANTAQKVSEPELQSSVAEPKADQK